jgi:hypothetical protein
MNIYSVTEKYTNQDGKEIHMIFKHFTNMDKAVAYVEHEVKTNHPDLVTWDENEKRDVVKDIKRMGVGWIHYHAADFNNDLARHYTITRIRVQ